MNLWLLFKESWIEILCLMVDYFCLIKLQELLNGLLFIFYLKSVERVIVMYRIKIFLIFVSLGYYMNGILYGIL